MKNIVLIGMPGCGKSTLGRLLAQHLKRPFYDADNVLEKLEGKTIKSCSQSAKRASAMLKPGQSGICQNWKGV